MGKSWAVLSPWEGLSHVISRTAGTCGCASLSAGLAAVRKVWADAGASSHRQP